MSDKVQNFSNHTRRDPWFHFVLLPFFLVLLIAAVWGMFRFPHHHRLLHFHLLLALIALSLLTLALKMRMYALKVQDRVIRLEERLRLSTLLPEPLRARIPELTVAQLVALRFASDAEVPGLVEQTLRENLKPVDIKKSIQNWRPDYLRV